MFTNQEILAALQLSEIGGGELYDHDVTESDADVVVTSKSGFTSNCGDAGKVVWIPGDESINLSGWSGTVRATIASDRGINGSNGALLYTTDKGESSHAWDGGHGRGVLHFRGSGRMTGLRYRGPYHDYYDDDRYPGYIPLDSGSSSERRRKRAQRYARGMKTYSSNVEIDNCEIYGWPNSAIQMGSAGSYGGDPHIHHIYGHDCMMVGFGYVVDVLRGNPTIEKSYFNAARHAVDGFGHEDCGYVLRDCVFGPSTYSHAVDMHCLSENGYSSNTSKSSKTWRGRAGGRMEIKNNTFCFRKDITGSNQEAVVIRGVPKDECVIENNRFMHPPQPSRNPGSSQGDAWRQSNLSSFNVSPDSRGYVNFSYKNNQFDSETTPWVDAYGAPVNLENPLETFPGGMPEKGLSRDALLRRKELLSEIGLTFDQLIEIFK